MGMAAIFAWAEANGSYWHFDAVGRIDERPQECANYLRHAGYAAT
jgi:hypothetical protein